MFYVLTERVFKVGTGSTEKFALRSTNRTQWTISGGWTGRRSAERAAIAAMRTHTCLSAEVLSLEDMVETKHYGDHARGRKIGEFLKSLVEVKV